MKIENVFFSWDDIAEGNAILDPCKILEVQLTTLPGPVHGLMFKVECL